MWWVHSSFRSPGLGQSRRVGFTLVELVVVVLVLGIIASVAVPRVSHFSRQARLRATIAHLISVSNATERYRAINDRWPDDSYAYQVPPGLEDTMRPSDFGRSPIGGYYDWNGPGSVLPFIGLSIYDANGSTPSQEDMQAIDEMIDDGDAETGMIRWDSVRLQYVQDDNEEVDD